MALIQGLFDRPGGIAPSRDDLLQATIPHFLARRADPPSYWTLAKSLRTIPRSLVDRRRVGNQVHFSLTPRARDVLAGRVAAYVTGVGPYRPRATNNLNQGA